MTGSRCSSSWCQKCSQFKDFLVFWTTRRPKRLSPTDPLITGHAVPTTRVHLGPTSAAKLFYDREGDLSLDGRVRTMMFGANYATGPLMAGLRSVLRP